jgi:uncharacterized membrane protein (UPF0127 family)
MKKYANVKINGRFPKGKSDSASPNRHGNEVEIRCELADSLIKKIKGLSFRNDIDGGMLFIFGKEKNRTFTMRGMKFPLDFIFIGENHRIVDIRKDVPINEKKVVSKERFKYVIELKSGFCDTNRIGVDDAVIISVWDKIPIISI